MKNDEPVIGIDLGTTYSVVSIFQDNSVKVFQDEFGNKIIPSYVVFENEEKILVGDMAKIKSEEKYNAVIYDVKRLIGRKFNDENVIKDQVNWPFIIKEDPKTKKLKIVVNVKRARKKNDNLKDFNIHEYHETENNISDEEKNPNSTPKNEKDGGFSAFSNVPTVEKEFTPEEISSYILKNLKKMAENDLKKEVKKAVITVPAYFGDEQRESTKIAGELAGLEVLRIINEPTAAALAYGLNENNDNKNKKILVFDLGGGTFDVTILSIEYDKEKIFEVLSTDGDTHLGGQDFDQKLYDIANEKFQKENDNESLDKKVKAKNRVKKACENAKIILSDKDQTTIKLEKVYLGSDLEVTFTKKQFEELCKPYFDKCLQTVDNALKLKKLTENDINEVVLIGGSTRIPYIRNMLKNKFKNSKLCFNINPDETVSIGAAIQAAIITKKNYVKIRDVNVFDATPLSLGIGLLGEKMDINIKRGTPTPITRNKIYQTVKDNQTTVCIRIYEGEDKNLENNNLIGKFNLNNLPALPAGKAKVKVKFFVDENNILNVSATDASNQKNKNEITIINDSKIINKEEIEKIKKNIDNYDEYEKKNQFDLLETRSLKNDIQKFTEKIQNSTDNKTKYHYNKLLCKSFESYMEIFKFENLSQNNEAYLSKFKIYLTYLIKEYGVILSYGNLVEEDVINNIRNNLYFYVIILIKHSDVSVYQLLQDLNINKKINDFCCIFKIIENYNNGNKLYKNKELKEAGKCFSTILQEASIHDLDTQLSFVDEIRKNVSKTNSNKLSFIDQDSKIFRNYVSEAKSNLHNFYIQNTIDKADNLFKEAVKKNLIRNLNTLLLALDTFNLAIQLNKIENEDNRVEIIDKNKYQFCICRINVILLHILGEKYEKLTRILNELQNKLENIMDNIEEKTNITKIKKTAKECIKLILLDYPYPNYNNEYNVDDIFNNDNIKIRNFIRTLRTKYHPDRFNTTFNDNEIQEEHRNTARNICSHLNNIYDLIDNQI